MDLMACAYLPIDLNVIPQIDVFTENGYTPRGNEDDPEAQKIMGDNSIRVTATTVRIPGNGRPLQNL